MDTIITFILSNLSKTSVFDIFLILLSGGIIFILLNRYYKDKYKLVMETNKEALDLKNQIINSYNAINKNSNNFIKDKKNILSINNTLASNINQSANKKEALLNNQSDPISSIIGILFVFIYECNELHIFLKKINLYKKIEYSSNTDKLFESYKIEKEINDLQNILMDNIFTILKLFDEIKDEKQKNEVLKLQIYNLFGIVDNAFDKISKNIKEMDTRVEIIVRDLLTKIGKK
jgi:Ni,Fe-hydrogenase III component G